MRKAYCSISSASEVELIINRSRFIGRAYPAQSEGEALAHLEDIRKRHYDATHNCYAYRIGALGETARFSDDGEPGGTAGMPMMEVLQKRTVTDLIVIVTRYFGGILLGAGGLVRAYSACTADAVKAAGRITLLPARELLLPLDYARFGALEGFLRQNAEILDIAYTERVSVRMAVTESGLSHFLAELTERSDGRAQPQLLGECICRVPDTEGEGV